MSAMPTRGSDRGALGASDHQEKEPQEQPDRYPEIGRTYELKVWYALSVGDQIWEAEASRHVDFRAATEALVSIISANGGFDSWYDLGPRDESRTPWDYGASLGGTIAGSQAVDRHFQAGIYEVSERLKRPFFASLKTSPRWLIRRLGTYEDSTPMKLSLSMIKKIAQL
jgi:hypothetical protein